MAHDDQIYIDGLLNNSTVILNRIYSKFYQKVRGLVLKNSGNDEDAADLFQDSLMAIYVKGTKQYFNLTCPFEAFLYTVSHNIWVNELKRRKRWVTFLKGYLYISKDGKEDIDGVIAEIVCIEAREKLYREKMAELSQGCKDIIDQANSGKSMIEIAELLNIAHGAARKRKADCKKKMMELMEQSPEFESIKKCMYE